MVRLDHPNRIIINSGSSLVTHLIKNSLFWIKIRACWNVRDGLIVISNERVTSSWKRDDRCLVSFERLTVEVTELSLKHPSKLSAFGNQRHIFAQEYVLISFKINNSSSSGSNYQLVVDGVSSVVLPESFAEHGIILIVLIDREPVHLWIDVDFVVSKDI